MPRLSAQLLDGKHLAPSRQGRPSSLPNAPESRATRPHPSGPSPQARHRPEADYLSVGARGDDPTARHYAPHPDDSFREAPPQPLATAPTRVPADIDSLSSPIPFIWTLHPPAAPLGALCPTTASTFHGSAHSGGASLRRCFSQEVLLSGGVADDHLRTIHPFSSSPTTSLIIPSKRH